MTGKMYQIVFSGQLVDGVERATARFNLAKLYKTDVSNLDRLFQNERAILKKNLAEDAALAFLTVLKNAGVIGQLEEMPAAAGADSSKPAAATPPAPAAPAPTPHPAADTGRIPRSTAIDTGALASVTVAPPGEVIMTHPTITPPTIDTSNIYIAPVGEDLVTPPTLSAPDIDTSALSVAALGETLVDKIEVEPYAPDLSAIDLAPAGSTIGPEQTEPPPPPPDSSHLSLKDDK